jgi:peptidoglycan/LPS O-acetylase OafA/YrhL
MGNPMFRSIGIVGFSFYLLQGLGIDMILLFQKNILGHETMIFRSWTLTLSVLALTYFISIFTYSYIERPFFGKRKVVSSVG